MTMSLFKCVSRIDSKRIIAQLLGTSILLLLIGNITLTSSNVFGQVPDPPEQTGGNDPPPPPYEKVWLTSATTTYGHLIDDGTNLIPVVNLEDAECWLKINSHPSAPSIPWTEIIGNPDNGEVFSIEPVLNVFENGLRDSELLFPSSINATSTTGVPLQPIRMDGNNQWGTRLDIRTWKWMTQPNPDGTAEDLMLGPTISTDSVSIPEPVKQDVYEAGSWYRETRVVGPTTFDEIFVRFVYENAEPESVELKFYLFAGGIIPVQQRIQYEQFAVTGQTVNGASSGLRTWFLEIDSSLFGFNGNYHGVVDMVGANGEIIASAEVTMPVGGPSD